MNFSDDPAQLVKALEAGPFKPVFILPPFERWGSTPRLFREVVITEKLDGTNAAIYITEDNEQVFAGSRERWITPEDDNHGFARWVADHAEELKSLGPGWHYGEWFGGSVNKRYKGLCPTKRFALFNVNRWGAGGKDEASKPACCEVVPVLYRGPFSEAAVREIGEALKANGSVAVPGCKNPEGVVVFHVAAQQVFKYTLDGDGHKGAAKA